MVEASAEALRAGVCVGRSLAEARALCPSLLALPHEPAADDRAREALGRWLTRFTPVVATAWQPLADDEPAGKPLLLLDLTGCERLFGGVRRIALQVAAAMKHFRLPCRIAVAPTPGAAWAIASAGTQPLRVVTAPQLPAALDPLPVETLRLSPAVVASLRHLGLLTLGRLLAMPRDTLPARFGPTLLARIDQLLGDRPEPLTALAYDPPVETEMRFDGPVDSLEAVWIILEELLGRVVADLVRRGHGARRIELICHADPAARLPPVTRAVQLAAPTQSVRAMLELLRLSADQLECGEGFTRLQLKVPEHEKLTDRQFLFLEDAGLEQTRELHKLFERLQVRLGEQAVIRPAFVESHLPERAWTPIPALASLNTDFPSAALPRTARSKPGGSRGGKAARPAIPAAAPPPLLPRPTYLLPTPVEVRVLAEPSDDWQGRPAQFTWNGNTHRLVHVLGPERISGEWWRGHDKTRDYYDALDTTGRRFWLFRVIHVRNDRPTTPPTTRWFLHGLFH